jgi:hypothetical protein
VNLPEIDKIVERGQVLCFVFAGFDEEIEIQEAALGDLPFTFREARYDSLSLGLCRILSTFLDPRCQVRGSVRTKARARHAFLVILLRPAKKFEIKGKAGREKTPA